MLRARHPHRGLGEHVKHGDASRADRIAGEQTAERERRAVGLLGGEAAADQ